jgi:hypothetical protein
MGLLTPADYVACVEQAYRMHGEGRFYMDPKGHIVLDRYPGEWERRRPTSKSRRPPRANGYRS